MVSLELADVAIQRLWANHSSAVLSFGNISNNSAGVKPLR